MSSSDPPNLPLYARFCPEFISKKVLNDEERLRLYKSLTGYFIGPMPLDIFFEDFFADAKFQDEGRLRTDYSELRMATKERDMYGPWGSSTLKERLPPNVEIHISSDRTPDTCKLRPDAGAKLLSTISQQLSTKQIKFTAFDFTSMDIVIEFKFKDEDMPFTFVRRSGAAIESKDGGPVRGQLGLYAEQHLAYQPRLAVYHVIINREVGHIIRWDRSGAVVSEAFNPTKQPWIPRLISGLNQMDRTRQGFDDTVQEANIFESTRYRKEISAFSKSSATRGWKRLADGFGVVGPKWPVYKVQVADDSDPDGHRFCLVSRPFYVAHSPVGRATRVYLAYDLKDRSVRALKESWRVEGSVSEWTIHKTLREKGAAHALLGTCGGDVCLEPGDPPHRTVNQDFALSSETDDLRLPCHGAPMMHARIQHRILEPVAFPLSCANNSREVLTIFRDVLYGIAEAFHKAGILHGDVSPRNIMLGLRQGGGLLGILSDWDHAFFLGTKRLLYSSTTYQFMSIQLMKDPIRIPELIDDLESWFWSLVYIAVVYLKHDKDCILLKGGDFFSAQLENIEADMTISTTGHHMKKYYLEEKLETITFDSAPFTDFFRQLVDTWKDFYNHLYRTERSKDPVGMAKVRGELSDPQWMINEIDKALRRPGWLDDDIKVKLPEALTTADESVLEDASRVRGFNGSHIPGNLTRPTIATADGKDTTGTRSMKRLAELENLSKRRADSEKENAHPDLYPDVLIARPTKHTPDDVPRRAMKLKQRIYPWTQPPIVLQHLPQTQAQAQDQAQIQSHRPSRPQHQQLSSQPQPQSQSRSQLQHRSSQHHSRSQARPQPQPQTQPQTQSRAESSSQPKRASGDGGLKILFKRVNWPGSVIKNMTPKKRG